LGKVRGIVMGNPQLNVVETLHGNDFDTACVKVAADFHALNLWSLPELKTEL
jgi:hypothetical protein